MEKYINRIQAGQILAQNLTEYAGRQDVVILALPRGGVPVAFEIAKSLHAPLDVFVVRKIGVPGHRELAMGAIALGNTTVFNNEIIAELNIPKEAINVVIAEEKQELKRREASYRGNRPFPSLEGKTIILVDDGIATGATMRAAIKALRQLKPVKLIVAVPVAAQTLCDELKDLTDDFICPLRPLDLYAVGAWYDDFSQTEDEEVFSLLKQAREQNHV